MFKLDDNNFRVLSLAYNYYLTTLLLFVISYLYIDLDSGYWGLRQGPGPGFWFPDPIEVQAIKSFSKGWLWKFSFYAQNPDVIQVSSGKFLEEFQWERSSNFLQKSVSRITPSLDKTFCRWFSSIFVYLTGRPRPLGPSFVLASRTIGLFAWTRWLCLFRCLTLPKCTYLLRTKILI